ncbi:hypothetical protein IQ07DRAFT_582229 [Pyrenochaeta sp. DS3sAY3a]|nr:hypothetical protein IQ07DRAFT_582229 [Pyrenochaeta sp. DS3sAY3a]
MPPSMLLVPAFAPPLTEEAVKKCNKAFSAEVIIPHLLSLSHYFIEMTDKTNILGNLGQDPYCPTLRTLHERLANGQYGPSLLEPTFLTLEHLKTRVKQRTDIHAVERPLADFEDLYYALIARLQDLHDLIKIRLKSGFSQLTDLVYEGGITIAALHTDLEKYWLFLNNAACGKALDDAIRRARAKATRDEVLRQVQANELSRQEANETIKKIYEPSFYDGILGMVFVNGHNAALIAGVLNVRYKDLLAVEKRMALKKKGLPTSKPKKKVKFASEHEKNNQQEVVNQCAMAEEHIESQQVTDCTERFTELTVADEPTPNELIRLKDPNGKDAVQPFTPIVSEPANYTTTELANNLANQPVTEVINRIADHFASGPIKQTTSQPIDQFITEPAPKPPGAATDNHPLDMAAIEAGIHHERAQQEALYNHLQWEMRFQRVNEYRNYLRNQASRGLLDNYKVKRRSSGNLRRDRGAQCSWGGYHGRGEDVEMAMD